MKKWTMLSMSSSLSLDIIRVIAVQLVLIGHSISYFDILHTFQQPQAPYMQNIAVLIFFILSGLLISYTVFSKIDNHEYNFKIFLIDRFARIYSALIPALLFITGIDAVNLYFFKEKYIYTAAFDLKTFLGNLIMLQDYPLINKLNKYLGLPPVYLTSFASGRPLWTLAIEWWLYLVFGWIILRFVRDEQRKFSDFIILLFISIVPLYNLVGGRGHGLSMFWIFGVTIYLLLNINYFKIVNIVISIGLSMLFFILAMLVVYKTKIEYNAFFACILAMSLLFLLNATQKIEMKYNEKVISIIRFFANYSFTLYLIHYSIVDLIFNMNLDISRYFQFIFAFVICNVISMVLALFTEMKHKNLSKFIKLLLFNKQKLSR